MDLLARSFLRCRPCLFLFSESATSRRLYRRSAQKPLPGVETMIPGKEIKHLIKKYVDDELIDVVNEDADEEDHWSPQNDVERRSYRDYIYRQKFKRLNDPKEPSLLTWAAKCQIKYLHERYPDEWTAEKISENFPVSVNDARRLVRHTRIFPKTRENIEIHDALVKERWKALKSGRGADIVTKDQRRRFAEEKLPLSAAKGIASMPAPPIPIDEPKPPQLAHVKGPFTALIKTYIKVRNERLLTKYPQLAESSLMGNGSKAKDLSIAPYSCSSTKNSDLFKVYKSDPNYFYDEPTSHSAPHTVTVDDVQFQFPEEESDDAGDPDIRIRKLSRNEIEARKHRREPVKTFMQDEIMERIVKKSENPEVFHKWLDRFAEKDEKDIEKKAAENVKIEPEFSPIPPKKEFVKIVKNVDERDRITIPDKRRKPGAIYRLKDTFYDDRGQFLYRIPGIDQLEQSSAKK